MHLYSRRPLPMYCARLCAWAESTWPAVGRVDRRGQQKHSICDVCRPCQPIWSIMNPVFQRFRLICCAYKSLRCLDLQIWRFLCWQTDGQNWLLYPLRIQVYCSVPGKHPLPGERPCSSFQGVNATASIQTYRSYIPGKCPCGPKSRVMIKSAHGDTMVHVP